MDALKFVKERNRMCKSFGGSCDGCPADKNTCCDTFEWQEELVAIVEEWFAAHPCKTRQDAFLKQYPNAPKDCEGILMIDPCDLDITIHGKDECYTDNCLKCRHEYWSREVK